MVKARNRKRRKFYRAPEYLEGLERVARNIRRIRQASEWTQEDVANRFGDDADARVIQRAENRETNLTMVTITRLAKALGVDIVELFRP